MEICFYTLGYACDFFSSKTVDPHDALQYGGKYGVVFPYFEHVETCHWEIRLR